ncbi:interleukin-12 receptor subunit beta-1-like [Sinocyclocheilus anshuiensis]|uniref:interleukin-12 receptor subunit beta-1-like n=1 Tax=Sinocyclocheilus anshuiensis TaxID=1608454 RepID=UPI0007B812E5|nr:PREDICTED: interleukin-12 receptor subunit beta-1-like [Sinocyclocheilus anshuiensis]
MRMRVAVLVLVVSVSLTEAGCVSTSHPHCYKKSTRPEEDFICEWDERNPEKSQTHTLHIWDSEKKQFLTHMNCGKQAQTNILLEQLGITNRKTDIWVQTQVGNLTCNSSKISVILECMVKYSKPQILRMKRLAGILKFTLDKPKDNKGAKYEIRWRERGSEWQNATFETKDSTEDFYMLHLQYTKIYQIQLRRQAKLQSSLCENSLHALWSDWSLMVDVPSEIRRTPVIRWVVNNLTNGTRDITLSWDVSMKGTEHTRNAPPDNESVGGVKYNLTLSVWPCTKKQKGMDHLTVNQTYNTSITYSEARISIFATNNVGSSPQKQIIIPAVKHLNYCDSHMSSNVNKAMKTCLEWYKLEDGETRPRTVNKSPKKSFQDIKNEVENFVRHYYFLHTMKKNHYKTAVMCPFYSKQRAPINGPANVNISDVTHESAVVSWFSIPVVEQRGFLQHYVIWISGQGNTKFHKVSAHKTSFLIKGLHPGASYTISIAGRTEAGTGPNSTVNFETHSKEMGLSWQDHTILIICVVALLCTIICSVAVRRLKLLPEVPSPVLDTIEFRCPEEQDLSQMMEEVHEFVLLLRQDLSKPREDVTPEQGTLLQDFGLVVIEEEDEEDEEGGVTDLSSMTSCCYPNPGYRGQTLQLPEPFYMTDSTSKDNDIESTYRNGLSFETRVLECDKTSL